MRLQKRKGKQYLFHFPLAPLTWAPTPSLEPEEAWFLWLDSEHHDAGKCALNLDSCELVLCGSLWLGAHALGHTRMVSRPSDLEDLGKVT